MPPSPSPSPPPHPWHPIPPSPENTTCTVSLLQAGTLKIPLSLVLLPSQETSPSTSSSSSSPPDTHYPVPDYCFLISHPRTSTTLLFDLAMRPDLHNLPPTIVKNTLPNFPASPKSPATILRDHGSPAQQPENVHAIVFSHTHFDHVGDGGKADFPAAELWLGCTGCTYARPGYPAEEGAAVLSENFAGRVVVERVVSDERLERDGETARVGKVARGKREGRYDGVQIREEEWVPVGAFERAVDVFGDGAAYLVDAPGHAAGHQMMLIRVTAGREGEEDGFVLLAGDGYHHPALLEDPGRTARPPFVKGGMHLDPEVAVDTMWRMRAFAKRENVWVIGAHDFSVGEGMGWGREGEVEGLVELNEWRKKGWKGHVPS